MTILIALALAYAGLTALCFGMQQHRRRISSAPPTARTIAALRSAGSAFLGLSLLTCVAGFSGSLGFVAWLGLLTAAALPLAFLLPFAPRAVVVTGACAPLAAAVLALTST